MFEASIGSGCSGISGISGSSDKEVENQEILCTSILLRFHLNQCRYKLTPSNLQNLMKITGAAADLLLGLSDDEEDDKICNFGYNFGDHLEEEIPPLIDGHGSDDNVEAEREVERGPPQSAQSPSQNVEEDWSIFDNNCNTPEEPEDDMMMDISDTEYELGHGGPFGGGESPIRFFES